MRVEKKAPMKPSQVFAGESWMSGVLPKWKPQTNAQMSLHTTNKHGMRNQNRPRKILTMWKDPAKQTPIMARMVHESCLNWRRYFPFSRCKTKRTNPMVKRENAIKDWFA